MSAVLDQDTLNALSQSTPMPSKAPSNRSGLLLGFLLGAVLAGAISFIAWQDADLVKATSSPLPASPAQTDPRLERLLSLAESQRDCDTACLGDLRIKADKVVALEQALGNLQAEAADAAQRFAGLEAEKAGLMAKLSDNEAVSGENKMHIQALEKDKADLAAQMEQQKTELQAGYKQQIAALETEKNGLAEQSGKKDKELTENQTHIQALEKDKADLAVQMEKQKAGLEAGYKQQIASLEAEKSALVGQASKESAQANDYKREIGKLENDKAGLLAQMEGQKSGLGGHGERPAAKPDKQPSGVRVADLQAPVQGIAKAQPDMMSKWTIIGMTESTVVVSTADRRVVALAAGETMDGMTVHHIDMGKGVVQTNFGDLWYTKKEK